MRRPATWLALGVVLLVGVAAVADAVRQKASEPQAASTTTATGTTTRASPATGLRGVLYYTDEECMLRAVQLPDVRRVEGPAWNECLFSVSPDALRVAHGDFIWHPGGTTRAAQSAGSIIVVLQEGTSESSYTFLGSAASFSPQALLTFALGTEIRAMDAVCPLLASDAPLIPARAIRRCSSVVLPSEAVERAARQHPNAPDDPSYPVSVTVREASWLRDDRLALLLTLRIRGIGERFDLVGLFEDGAIVETVAAFNRLHGLEASPGGSSFGVLTDARAGLLLLDRDGRSLTLPQLTGARTFTWSPDDEWIAIATSRGVYLVQPSRAPRVRRLGILARDLAWRAVFVS